MSEIFMKYHVTQLLKENLDEYVRHLHQHMNDSGLDDIIYTPYKIGHNHPIDEMRESITKRMNTELNSLNWERAFIVKVENHIIGHLDLRGEHLESSLHRCRLGMGLDKEYRGQGLGAMLINEAIKWLKAETAIDWIDLYTFSHNYAAIKLYKKCGFIEVGSISDRFRVDGISITDLQMTLKITRT